MDRHRISPQSVADKLDNLLSANLEGETDCGHIQSLKKVAASSDGCQQCLEMDSMWVNLRMCLVCGQVGCCDDSPSRHAAAHFRVEGPPIVRSFEPGESWRWCYVDEVFV